jgi:FkbM family methyltransferase
MMNFFKRLLYAFDAAKKSSSIAVNPLASSLFLLIPERLSSLVKPVCQFQWQNFNFFARRADWGPVNTVLLEREYDFAKHLLKDNQQPIILDLGANIGTFSLFVFGIRPLAICHSVEASTDVYSMLDRNCRANPSLNWHTYQAAVWGSSGEIRFQTSKHTSTQGSVSQQGNEVVNAITLAQLLNNLQGKVDILKMDIEGAEEEVLCTSESLLSRVKHLIVQIHPARINQERVEKVLRQKFDFLYRVPSRSPNPLLLATCQQQDSLQKLWASDRATSNSKIF